MTRLIQAITLALILCFGVAPAMAQQHYSGPCGSMLRGGTIHLLPDCNFPGQQAGHGGSNGRYFIGQAMQQRRQMEMRRRYEMQMRQRQMMSQQHRVRVVHREVHRTSVGGGSRVVGPPKRVTPSGTGQVTINREFDDGQSYCSKYVPGTRFEHWNGSGPGRTAHCVD